MMMFQNDEDQQRQLLAAAQAASSRQSSSARADRGQMYAIFAASLVLSTWFNLIAQAQTGVSLCLLAIIGFLLARVSDQPPSAGLQQAAGQGATGGRKAWKGAQRGGSVDTESGRGGGGPAGCGRERDRKGAAAKEKEEEVDHEEQEGTWGCNLLAMEADEPLLERANEAIDLLRALSSLESSQDGRTTLGGSLLCNQSLRRHFYEGSRTRSPSSRVEAAKQHQRPQASPSASASSHASSSSTGYNSDSHSRLGSASVQLVQLQPRPNQPVGLLEELAEPSALKLALRQLERRAPSSEPLEEEEPSGAQEEEEEEEEGEEGEEGEEEEEVGQEQHYSAPASCRPTEQVGPK